MPNFIYRYSSFLIVAIVSIVATSCDEDKEIAYNGAKLWFQQQPQTERNNADVIVDDSTLTLKIARRELKEFSLAQKVELQLIVDTLLGNDGYQILTNGATSVKVQGQTNIALLYGVYELLRQQNTNAKQITARREIPAYDLRMLNHWDNLDGTVERGFAGKSIWEWDKMTNDDFERYKAYARANASVGINAVVINNVNASPEILSVNYLPKVARIADILRPYGIKVFLSVNFSSPMALAGFANADPLNPAVCRWWRDVVKEIYSHIPDFGGFLVKANSEGLPGPLDYNRTHADGANMLATALNPYGGVVLWRAFVYSPSDADRAKQAYLEFMPHDGQFAPNVIIQIKNGPIDFQPREPFSPLFGALRQTQMAVELQITQEYTGAANHLCYLPTMWREALLSDTYRDGEGSTIATLTQTKLSTARKTAIAGVANIGNDENWCGNPMAQANWYAFGRMAWNVNLAPDSIAKEWIRQTMPNMPQHAENTLVDVLMESREAVVDYMMPLGLHHIFAWGHHYGPEPWCNIEGARADWMPKYYHRADRKGLGTDRSATGSNAVAQYNQPLTDLYGNIATCPDEYLLWFHHVGWRYIMKSGRTMWNELCYHYDRGLTMTGHFIASWKRIKPFVSPELWNDVNERLIIQRDDARWWHDACLLYFQQYSKMPIPQKTIYKLEDMQKFRIDITNYENPKEGYKGEKLAN